MDQAQRLLQLFGTFLPLVGIALTFFLAGVLKGVARWATLIIIPILIYFICTYWGGFLATDGNLLYVTILLVYLVLLCVYYPALAIAALFLWMRRNKGSNSQA